LSVTCSLPKGQNKLNYGSEYINIEIGLTTYIKDVGPSFCVTGMLVGIAILTNTTINPPTCWTI